MKKLKNTNQQSRKVTLFDFPSHRENNYFVHSNFIKMNKVYLLSGLLLLTAACSNTDVIEENSSNVNINIIEEKPYSIAENFNLEISYNGKVYNVPCTTDAEGETVYLDEEFQKLYDQEISQAPNLTTLSHGENKIAYFSSQEEMFKELGYTIIDTGSGISSREVSLTDTYSGRAELWDDTGFGDRSISFEIDYSKDFKWSHLKYPYGFNDKTSALKVWSRIPNNDTVIIINNLSFKAKDLRVVFIGYEDDNYRGKQLCCIPPNGTVLFNGLIDSGVYENGRLKGIGWNDKITSVVLKIAYAPEISIQ